MITNGDSKRGSPILVRCSHFMGTRAVGERNLSQKIEQTPHVLNRAYTGTEGVGSEVTDRKAGAPLVSQK